jgi:hypothetical protein
MKGRRGRLYPLTQNIAVDAVRPGVCGANPETPGSPETPAFQGQHPRKDPSERVGVKVSLIGFVLATRAPVRLLEDIIPVPFDSTAFLGLKFKSVK